MGAMLARQARAWLGALALLGLAGSALAQAFSFVALGDLPYGSPEKAYPSYRQLIASINQLKPTFSIHVGDIKSGSTLCSDREFEAQRAHFDLFEAPVVYTPGDNEWTDCHRRSNGGYEPQERLQALRRLFFRPGLSLGARPLAVQSQAELMPEHAGFVENQRWLHEGILFVTVHMVGSNNNMQVDVPGALQEFALRDAANAAWIRAAFHHARATGTRALVLAMQANPLLGRNLFEDFPKSSGFRVSIGETLLPLAATSDMPVLLIHGDTHWYRFDQPFSWQRLPLRQLSRLEVPGGSDVRALRVSVDLSKVPAFSVELIEPLRGP
jgi:hypothetical protein